MREYKAETVINAPAEVIWELLADADGYPNWDPGMDRLEGAFALGQNISFYTKANPSRSFQAMVTTFNPGQMMVLSSGLPLGLFKAERTHTLTPLDAGRTHFTTGERFSGLLLPLFGRAIPDLTRTFEAFAAGLKARAEAG